MPNQQPPVALVAIDAPKRVKPSNYPEPFASQMQGREIDPWVGTVTDFSAQGR
jgi:hypothetical protein